MFCDKTNYSIVSKWKNSLTWIGHNSCMPIWNESVQQCFCFVGIYLLTQVNVGITIKNDCINSWEG